MSTQSIRLAVVGLLLFVWALPLEAQRRGGGGRSMSRGGARSSVNMRSSGGSRANFYRGGNVGSINRANVNRVNRDINIDRDIDINGGRYGYGGYRPVARAAAVTAGVAVTAAAIGSMVYSIPDSCSLVEVNGVTYQQCGSTWYQPQFVGDQTAYVVVSPP